MGRNGIRFLEREDFQLPPEVAETMRFREEAKRIAVFGAARILEEGHAPSTGQVDDLAEQIEELCTGRGGRQFAGIHHRSLQGDRPRRGDGIDLMWNPAGTMGGFGVDVAWDGAVAHAGNLAVGSERVQLEDRRMQKYAFSEGLFIDRVSGDPFIRRDLYSRRENGPSAEKLATAQEIMQTSQLLQRFAELDAPELATEALPIYLEIGYGLDPSALRGERKYMGKKYVGVDRATGDYENPIAEYPEAVHAETARFAGMAASDRPGEHIAFEVGDAVNIDLPDKSVREIFMSNVINAPLDDEQRGGILREAARLLERSGSLVLRAQWHQDQWTEEALIAELRQAGFTTWRTVSPEDTEHARMDAVYGKPTQVPAPDGYYAIATASR